MNNQTNQHALGYRRPRCEVCDIPCRRHVQQHDLGNGGCECWIPLSSSGMVQERPRTTRSNWPSFNFTKLFGDGSIAFLADEARDCLQRGFLCDKAPARGEQIPADANTAEGFNKAIRSFKNRRCGAAARACVCMKRKGACCAENFYAICAHKGTVTRVRIIYITGSWKRRAMPSGRSSLIFQTGTVVPRIRSRQSSTRTSPYSHRFLAHMARKETSRMTTPLRTMSWMSSCRRRWGVSDNLFKTSVGCRWGVKAHV